MEAVNVSQIQHAATGCAGGFILKHDGEIPVAAPFGRDEGIAVENVLTAVARPEIVF
jgi:hypothetical protein